MIAFWESRQNKQSNFTKLAFREFWEHITVVYPQDFPTARSVRGWFDRLIEIMSSSKEAYKISKEVFDTLSPEWKKVIGCEKDWQEIIKKYS